MTAPDVAYYYPAPYWPAEESSWVKSLLLFFDRIAILLPGYMYGRHSVADPSLVEPLTDRGLLEVLEPATWIDQALTEELATVLVELLTAGVFDELPPPQGDRFAELSHSRIGYGADVELSTMLVDELKAKGLARDSQDGVSIPLHPIVRTTILTILGQLARAAGDRRGLSIHPATNNQQAIGDLIRTLSREPMPSAGHVVAFDLEAVSLDLDSVPLDDVLDFRESERDSHTAYMRSLRGFLDEIAREEDTHQREQLLIARREELADSARSLQRTARRAFARNLGGWALGLAGATWSVAGHDPLGIAISAAGVATGAIPDGRPSPSAYSYVFAAARQL